MIFTPTNEPKARAEFGDLDIVINNANGDTRYVLQGGRLGLHDDVDRLRYVEAELIRHLVMVQTAILEEAERYDAREYVT